MSDKHQTNVRLSKDARAMLDKMCERHEATATDTITKALYLMWLVTGGGKSDVDVTQAEYILRTTGALE